MDKYSYICKIILFFLLFYPQSSFPQDQESDLGADANYLIFIVDLSGGMVQFSREKMINQLMATIASYPDLKGIQIMSDMGSHMLPQYQHKWIPNTPGQREIIEANLHTWINFSNSSPHEGLMRALRFYYDPKKIINIYVFGDDFAGETSADEVIASIEAMYPDDDINKNLNINAVLFASEKIENRNFENVMRAVTKKYGGTFVIRK